MIKTKFLFSFLKSQNALQFANIHTTFTLYSSAKAMKKILGKQNSSKRKHFSPELQSISTTTSYYGNLERKKTHNNPRRTAVLNKLFMEHITDLMASGTTSQDFVGRGIEVNRVKVTSDYSQILVYWVAKESEKEEDIDGTLKKNAGILRHELSQLKLMGIVPKITFIKDKHYAHLTEIDARLTIADFGEDHVPINLSEKLKTQLELETGLSHEEKEKIKQSEETINEDYEPPLPSMPQNVFGLDHAFILERIKKQIKKSETLHRLSSYQDNNQENYTENLNPVTFPSEKSEREALKDFLKKRQVEQSKLWKDKNYSPDIEYIKQDLIERAKDDFIDDCEYENKDEDFIIEDEK